MGLDVSLYKYTNYQKTKELEAKYHEGTDKIWEKISKGKKYELLTEEEKDKARKLCKALADKLHLGEYGDDEENTQRIEMDSKKYPDHMFKIGYFRSSYNDGGLNHILSRTIGKDLYYIFEPEDYEVGNDWNMYLERAKDVLKEFKEYVDKYGDYDVMSIHGTIYHPESQPKNEGEALKAFFNEKESHKGEFTSYSNGLGEFYLKGVKAFGFIATKAPFGDGIEMQVIVENKHKFKGYIESVEIVVETLEYINSQEDSDSYKLSWSA